MADAVPHDAEGGEFHLPGAGKAFGRVLSQNNGARHEIFIERESLDDRWRMIEIVDGISGQPVRSQSSHGLARTRMFIQPRSLPTRDLFERLLESGFATPVIISPRAYVSRHSAVGDGSIVMHGATVNAGAIVGRNCILNSRSLIEHGATLGDHCHIATAAVVNGDVRIGAGAFIGSGVIVRHGVAIGQRCVIGMGERVLTNCADGEQRPLASVR